MLHTRKKTALVLIHQAISELPFSTRDSSYHNTILLSTFQERLRTFCDWVKRDMYQGRFPFALFLLACHFSFGSIFGIGENLSCVELQRLPHVGCLFYHERLKRNYESPQRHCKEKSSLHKAMWAYRGEVVSNSAHCIFSFNVNTSSE